YLELIKTKLPQTLKILSIFEDHLQNYRLYFQDHGWDAEPEVAAALADRSQGLGELYVSYWVDASHWLQSIQPQWEWKKLRFLTLTSRL
ncbi:hypothetical protein B0T17DRAFT_462683, partial [Bombardia bombarda]